MMICNNGNMLLDINIAFSKFIITGYSYKNGIFKFKEITCWLPDGIMDYQLISEELSLYKLKYITRKHSI